MSTKLNNIRKLNQQVKSLKGQLKAKNNGSFTSSNAPVNYGTSWAGSSRPLRMRQSERIATVVASSTAGDYSVSSFAINPGNSTTFPWLGNIARLFDRYKFHDLKFKFINYASTVINGNVTMAIDFDTLDTPPSDSVGMSNMAKFVSFAPWKVETLTVPVNRRGVQQYLFTYDSNAESGSNVDLKTYNLGNFLISTEGLPADQLVGYVVAEYDVELFDKNNDYQSVLDVDFASYHFSSGTVDMDEHSGLSVTYDSSTKTIGISGLIPGEEYNCYINLPSGSTDNLITGLTPVTGESYITFNIAAGVLTANANMATITSSASTINSLTVVITRLQA